MIHPDLRYLFKRGSDFLGSQYAIMGGAMSWISERNLVSAISNAGGFGVIACGAMTPDLLDNEIKETFKLTQKPFGVNLITMHPDLDFLVEICIKNKVSHIVLAGGLPKDSNIAHIKNANIKVICFAPNITLFKRLVKKGVDAIIIEGSEAGGHIGPVSTSVLAQEILPFMLKEYPEIPVFVAGGIGRGEAILSYLEQGASGVQIGTGFVCADESIAHDNFKNLFIRSKAKDAVSSVQIDPNLPVIPVRAIENKATKSFLQLQIDTAKDLESGVIDKNEAQLKIEHFWVGALRKAVIDGDIESGSVMAGQSVGMVDKTQSVNNIIHSLIEQANKNIS